MGEEVTARVFSGEDRQRYRQKVRACLDVFARLLAEARFDAERRSFGLEIELNLTDEAGDPAMVNAAALEAIADPDFQTELGQFNVEINLEPRLLGGAVMSDLETSVRASLNTAEDLANTAGAHMMLIGILPTVTEAHLTADSFSANPRYALLNEQIFAARGEDIEISISGVERLATFADTIAPEAACTSVQLHQLCDPEAFPAYWNAAQAIAALQVAIGANSPFFFGRELWARDQDRRSSSRRPTPGPTSSRRRAYARACGSASAGSRRSSTSSRRTRATSRPCSRSRRRGPAGDLRGRRRAEARRASSAQRHDLPLEPADLRGR